MESIIQAIAGKVVPEQRLWRAVLTSTLKEWFHGPLRKKREAEHFLLHDNRDYPAVCFSAGIDPTILRNCLLKFRNRGVMQAPLA